MQNRDGVQKGPQDHAEGGHGAKTRSKILEQLHSGNGAVAQNNANGANGPAGTDSQAHHAAAHRLFQDRQQHDEAEKRSEKTRLNRELERGHVEPDTTGEEI
jgi:hypothetical protein